MTLRLAKEKRSGSSDDTMPDTLPEALALRVNKIDHYWSDMARGGGVAGALVIDIGIIPHCERRNIAEFLNSCPVYQRD